MYVGLGCGGCALVIGVMVVVSVVGGVRLARKIERDMENPVARAEQAKRLLGTEELPEGYHAVVSVSLPLVFETVILADRPGVADHELSTETEKLFVYVELIRGSGKWRQDASGKADPEEVLAEQGIRMEGPSEEIGRGEIALEGATVDYVSERGTLFLQGHRFEGLTTFLMVHCEGSKKLRVGLWSHGDPEVPDAEQERDHSGTCADPAELEAFLGPFDLCR